MLKKQIATAFPEKYEKGVAYLDIESPYFEKLRDLDLNHAEFKRALKLYLDILNIAKNERPNVKWGYYGIPFTTYWERTPSFYDKNFKISKLLTACDIFFPSLYTFYENNEVPKDENKRYAIENTTESIKLGISFKKPVIPFIWHRYHPSNPRVGLKVIPDAEWFENIENIASVQVNGKKVDGILWWGADQFLFDTHSKAVHDEFKGTSKEFSIHSDRILSNKANRLRRVLNK